MCMEIFTYREYINKKTYIRKNICIKKDIY